MKIALVNLCKTEDFAEHKYYQDSMDYLKEEGIDYVDFASGAKNLDEMIAGFNKAIASDADIVWIIRGGLECIEAMQRLDWDKIAHSGKRFYGLRDFTHFSTKAVSKGMTCFYGQALSMIKQFFPKKSDRKFITDFLKSGDFKCDEAVPLANTEDPLNIDDVKVVGGHLLIFTFMQSHLEIDLKDRFVFIEYHHSAIGEGLRELGYFIEQLKYTLRGNLPLGFILGRSELKTLENETIPLESIKDAYIHKLTDYELPIYYLDHYNNTIRFS
jgi:muramoyltetrapeptide carboxypeptidase LdcA involved in peptidoglycan recycling